MSLFGTPREPSRRDPGAGYPTPKVHKNEPVSVGGPENPANLKDTLLGGSHDQPQTSFMTKKWVDPLKSGDSSHKTGRGPPINPNQMQGSGTGSFQPV